MKFYESVFKILKLKKKLFYEMIGKDMFTQNEASLLINIFWTHICNNNKTYKKQLLKEIKA
jgi:hypothetical protein